MFAWLQDNEILKNYFILKGWILEGFPRTKEQVSTLAMNDLVCREYYVLGPQANIILSYVLSTGCQFLPKTAPTSHPLM